MTTEISDRTSNESHYRQIYHRLGTTPEQLAQFCQRWQIVELSLFGSILRDDFNMNSDVDLLVTFKPNHSWGLEFIQMREQLSTLFNRPVDLMTRQSIINSPNILRRENILDSAEVIYVQKLEFILSQES
ncbi:nucleotidyltransferase family protein [Roseofilum reptotaenium CS-1145]|uniref:DNA polymerase subunit beta n=1 Tax=Roseofilum reptotaenium AO1-A TaxID=1925591 RepID=A0A1L9QLY8_9CYAN|nr:nucleotidyltransferase family protein [Roseofilum reptotaenium]MDB9517438.1 nucleotidyltransferase family protein [Roseofilum reptotaenium CS-1145]OJJ20713.1 DNA polymerase subunit beta [Roseofilum reptotaenium AO1-A]